MERQVQRFLPAKAILAVCTMKFYEIQAGTPEGNCRGSFDGVRYVNLGDAVNKLKNILETMKKDSAIVDDDLSFWVVRKSSPKKGKKKQPEEVHIIQTVAGKDEDTGEFCYEGVSFLTSCKDFESLILTGRNEAGFIGSYNVLIEKAPARELCFFSDLESILSSLEMLSQATKQIENQKMTLFRQDENGANKIACFEYVPQADGSLKLEGEITGPEEALDYDKLAAFAASQQTVNAAPAADQKAEPETSEEASQTDQEAQPEQAAQE